MRMITGKVTGTGATLNVAIGFKPDWVRVTNVTSKTMIEWKASDEDLANEHGMNTAAADGARTVSASAAAGIAVYSGVSGTTSEGFTIGASAVPNVNTNVLSYEAGTFDN